MTDKLPILSGKDLVKASASWVTPSMIRKEVIFI
jgi:hypothetical protein